MKLKNTCAIVTGGAMGIGFATAKRLLHEGAIVTIWDLNAKALKEAVRQLSVFGTVYAYQCDVTNKQRVMKLAATAKKEMGKVDVLINNAGFGTLGQFVDVEISKTLDMIAVHVTAPTRLIKAALPGMLARHEGNIINIASAAPFVPVSGSVNYNGTKSYLIAFSECLQLEVKDAGVRVQALCPGFTRTGFHSVDEFKNVDFSTIPAFMWMPADKVVAESWRALRKKKVIFIPGFINRLTFTLFNGLFRYIASKRPVRPPSQNP